MNIDWNNIEIFIKPGPTDMRKQIKTLSVYVAEETDEDPLSGNLYIFCGKNRRLIKALYWDRNGFCLWQKRLEKDRFKWPQTSDEVMNITRRELSWLLDGLNIKQAHKPLKYSMIF